jgi:hypothetical protein
LSVPRGRRVNEQRNSGGQAPRRARRATSTRGRFAAREAEMCPPSGQGALHIQSEALTDKEEAYEYGGATDRPRLPIERPKVLERPSSTLARSLRFHTRFTRRTNSTPPPSVRTRNLRTQECSHHKGSLRSTSRVSSLLTSMRVCALGLGSKWGGPKAAVGQGP